MTIKSLGNPFSEKTDLRHGADCGCESCLSGHGHDKDNVEPHEMSGEQMMEHAVESAIVRSVFGQSDIGRRSFMGMIGG
ncbi:MAG: nitrate ABC transporter substrate-binding protein, partial [Pseudomonadota bacterium]